MIRDWTPQEDNAILQGGWSGCAGVAKKLKRSKLSVTLRWKRLTGNSAPKPIISEVINDLREEVAVVKVESTAPKQFTHSTTATISDKKQLDDFLKLFFEYCSLGCSGFSSGFKIKITFEAGCE